MSNKGEKLFGWIQMFLLLLGLCLTGAFSRWITLISPDPTLGWSIYFATMATNLLYSWRKSPDESELMSIDELRDWQRIRAKGKRHYLLIPGVVFPMLLLTFCYIAISLYSSIAESDNSGFENFYKVVPLIFVVTGIFYLIRLGIWKSVEKRYRASLQPSNQALQRRPRTRLS